MSRHISKNKKSFLPAGKKCSGTVVFYLSKLDSEGYDLSAAVLAMIAVGILLFIISGFLRIPEIAKTAAKAAAILISGILLLNNCRINFRAGRFLFPAEFILVSAGCCFAAGTRVSGLVIVVLYEIFCVLKNYLSEKEQRAAHSDLRIQPDFTYVIEEGEKRKRKTIHVKEGDVIFVGKGEIVPADGYVVEGTASLDISPLTHTQEKMTVPEGSGIMSGCMNSSESFVMRATSDSRYSTAQRIYSSFLKCTSEPMDESEKTGKIIEYVIPVLVFLFLITAFIVPIFNHEWARCLKKGVIFLLCAVPFSVTDSLDMALFNGAERIFSSGAVIKNSRIMHALAKVSTFVCNKTCTVTEDEYKIVDICPHEMNEDEMLSLINAVEKQSVHPIAKALRAYCGIEEIKIGAPDPNIEEIPGRGISAHIGDNYIYVGNAAHLFDYGVNSEVPDKQGSVIHLAVNGNYCGYIVLENKVRQGSYDAIEKLKACGVKNCAMISCDLRSVVRPIAGALNFNVVNAEMTPDTKISATEYLLSNKVKNTTLAFAGNGYDELEAASKADISISLGALGAENALSDFDVAVMGGGLSAVPEIVSASFGCVRAMRFNIVAFSAVRAAFILLALFGICPVLLCGVFLFLTGVTGFLISSVLFNQIKKP